MTNYSTKIIWHMETGLWQELPNCYLYYSDRVPEHLQSRSIWHTATVPPPCFHIYVLDFYTFLNLNTVLCFGIHCISKSSHL